MPNGSAERAPNGRAPIASCGCTLRSGPDRSLHVAARAAGRPLGESTRNGCVLSYRTRLATPLRTALSRERRSDGPLPAAVDCVLANPANRERIATGLDHHTCEVARRRKVESPITITPYPCIGQQPARARTYDREAGRYVSLPQPHTSCIPATCIRRHERGSPADEPLLPAHAGGPPGPLEVGHRDCLPRRLHHESWRLES